MEVENRSTVAAAVSPERRDRESRDSGVRGESWTAGGNYPSFTADRSVGRAITRYKEEHNASPFDGEKLGIGLEGEAAQASTRVATASERETGREPEGEARSEMVGPASARRREEMAMASRETPRWWRRRIVPEERQTVETVRWSRDGEMA
ncbi:hypothetical protein Syun_031381 [Stephania yunnanensis]|uniref:Uncharacterized protein n=1 Tax=Stephania yunnanensis TaxID=152371 RepID=A0AAP0E152_9MAGN